MTRLVRFYDRVAPRRLRLAPIIFAVMVAFVVAGTVLHG